jgi:hypothetical protein
MEEICKELGSEFKVESAKQEASRSTGFTDIDNSSSPDSRAAPINKDLRQKGARTSDLQH